MVVIEVNCGGTSLCTLFNVKNSDLRPVSLAQLVGTLHYICSS
jgi:hypothetical protein